MRARGLDNSEARQHVLMELYEKFFSTALKKDADRLGIVYTPVEVVDFIVNSADHVVRQEFGRSLSEEGVHVLDPFTGTGIFLVRLLQSALIRDTDLKRKYTESFTPTSSSYWPITLRPFTSRKHSTAVAGQTALMRPSTASY